MRFADQPIRTAIVTAISISFALYCSILFCKKRRYYKEYKKLKYLREFRKKEKLENLLKMSNYLNERKMSDQMVNEIVDMNIRSLLEYTKKELYNEENVLTAYQKKAYDANMTLNCLVDFVQINKLEINAKGPLFGLPISFKDNFLIKGYRSCAGCSYFLDKTVDFNSVIVEVIKDLGAIPFVKTNVPQTMMSTLSSNPIDGVTLNPVNIKMSPGGSSSGEAALIAAKGSIVGIGTDIGGSVRLPAAFCGIIGFKPTCDRISKKGLLEIARYSLVNSCCGFLGRDVSSIAFVFQHIVNSSLHRKLDPLIVPLDFDAHCYESKEKLKIGYFTFDGSFHAVPAIERAVLETVKGLERRGYEVVEWKPPVRGNFWLSLFLAAIATNKGKDLTQLCQYDELDFSVKNLMKILNWNIFQYYYYKTIYKLFRNEDFSIWVKASRKLSTSMDVMKLKSDIKIIRENFLKKMDEENIDAIICPTAGFVALPLRPTGSTTGMLSYQNLWNLIDFPAGTVPASHVTSGDIEEMIKTYPKNSSMWHKSTYENQLDSIGLPVSVQCVTKPWKEELCLRVMKDIEFECVTTVTQFDERKMV